MNIPKLKKIKTTKNYHGIPLEDDYSWVDQPNILEVLKDPKKLNTQVKDYIEANNKITEDYFTDVKELQKNLFNEIKGKIKLDDPVSKYIPSFESLNCKSPNESYKCNNVMTVYHLMTHRSGLRYYDKFGLIRY